MRDDSVATYMTSTREAFVSHLVSTVSLRRYLYLIGVAGLAPVAIFSLVLIWFLADWERSRIERASIRIAEQTSTILESELRILLAELAGLATSTSMRDQDFRGLHQEARRLVAGHDEVVLLRRLDETQLLNTQVPFGAPLPPAVPIPDETKQLFRQGSASVGSVYKSPISGEYRVPVVLPVQLDHGDPLLLAVTVPTTRFAPLLANAAPSGWVIGVADGNGTYVSRSQEHQRFTGTPGVREYLQLAVGDRGSFVSSNRDGLELLAGFARLDFAGWLIAANIPLAEVHAPLRRTLLLIALGFLAALAVALITAFVLARRLSRATNILMTSAAEVGMGRTAAVGSGFAELDSIGDAFVQADRKIVARTRELERVLEVVPAAVWYNFGTEVESMAANPVATELKAVQPPSSKAEGDTVGPQSAPTDMLIDALTGGEGDQQEREYLRDGEKVTLLVSSRPLLDNDGLVRGAVAAGIDITRRKIDEEKRKLLINELNHRVKNTLATVLSISQQTMRLTATKDEAQEALTSRLVALSRAHDILNKESWHSADVRDLVREACSVGFQERVTCEGPPTRLHPETSLALSLALHELVTNAAKYGALSSGGGRVNITWARHLISLRERLVIRWEEENGPIVQPPTRSGFGSRLLGRVFEGEDGDGLSIEYRPSGVICIMTMTLRASSG